MGKHEGMLEVDLNVESGVTDSKAKVETKKFSEMSEEFRNSARVTSRRTSLGAACRTPSPRKLRTISRRSSTGADGTEFLQLKVNRLQRNKSSSFVEAPGNTADESAAEGVASKRRPSPRRRMSTSTPSRASSFRLSKGISSRRMTIDDDNNHETSSFDKETITCLEGTNNSLRKLSKDKNNDTVSEERKKDSLVCLMEKESLKSRRSSKGRQKGNQHDDEKSIGLESISISDVTEYPKAKITNHQSIDFAEFESTEKRRKSRRNSNLTGSMHDLFQPFDLDDAANNATSSKPSSRDVNQESINLGEIGMFQSPAKRGSKKFDGSSLIMEASPLHKNRLINATKQYSSPTKDCCSMMNDNFRTLFRKDASFSNMKSQTNLMNESSRECIVPVDITDFSNSFSVSSCGEVNEDFFGCNKSSGPSQTGVTKIVPALLNPDSTKDLSTETFLSQLDSKWELPEDDFFSAAKSPEKRASRDSQNRRDSWAEEGSKLFTTEFDMFQTADLFDPFNSNDARNHGSSGSDLFNRSPSDESCVSPRRTISTSGDLGKLMPSKHMLPTTTHSHTTATMSMTSSASFHSSPDTIKKTSVREHKKEKTNDEGTRPKSPRRSKSRDHDRCKEQSVRRQSSDVDYIRKMTISKAEQSKFFNLPPRGRSDRNITIEQKQNLASRHKSVDA